MVLTLPVREELSSSRYHLVQLYPSFPMFIIRDSGVSSPLLVPSFSTACSYYSFKPKFILLETIDTNAIYILLFLGNF